MPSIDKPTYQRDSLHTTTAPVSGALDSAVVRDWLWAFAQQSLDYAILLVGTDARVLWANPGAAWTLAATAAEIVGSPIHRFFTGEDRAFGIPELETNTASREGASVDDRWMLRADGSPFWAMGRTIGLKRADGQPLGYLKIFRDRTEWQMRLAGLENQANGLVAEEQGRANAIETIGYGLENSLGALRNACAEVRRDAIGALPGALDTMEQHLDLATGLVEELARSAHVDAGTALQVQSLQLHEELQAALTDALQRHPRGGRRIELLLPPGLPISFEGDRLGVRQLFTSLIDNALRFTAEEGTIGIMGTVEGAQVVVRIEDDGAGIPTDMLEAIFNMFTRPTSKPGPTIAGAGLSLVRRLVKQHGGSVQAASPGPGKGSEFTVRLPIRQPGRGSAETR